MRRSSCRYFYQATKDGCVQEVEDDACVIDFTIRIKGGC